MEPIMDLVYLGLAAAFFLVTVALVSFCNSLKEDDK
jgi:hypothetical protein